MELRPAPTAGGNGENWNKTVRQTVYPGISRRNPGSPRPDRKPNPMPEPHPSPTPRPRSFAPARAAGRRWSRLLLLLCVAPILALAGTAAHKHRYTNRLIHSNDPYLQMHAHNPVDWYPWGPAAIAKAQRENKPIFVSIGYSTCYWCHVADRTLFSNPAIAKLMNRWFVNIIVDREQRPDIDQIYMLGTEIMNGQGGWPNNVFLTPDLKPFFAGSYFPPQTDEFGHPGFTQILRTIHAEWVHDRGSVRAKANRIYVRMKQVNLAGHGPAVPVRPRQWLAQAQRSTQARFDWKYGGLPSKHGERKFLRPPLLQLWFTDARLMHDAKAMEMLRRTLDAIVYGGIHDQIGGGFHRYSMDRNWSLPHFEKMLSDNAQLLELYARVYAVTRDPLYRSVALQTARYLERAMAAPGGGFYIAQDAQIHGVEGGGYVWTHGQITAALGPAEAKRFFKIYALTRLPNPTAEEELNGAIPGVLRVRVPIAATLKRAGFHSVATMLAALRPARAKLMAVRERNTRPAVDRKIVVSFNGLAIGAFAHASRLLDRPAYLKVAERAANRIWDTAYHPRTGTLMHEIYRGRAQTQGFLDDYALLGNGFMTLYQVTGQAVWRKRGQQLAQDILSRFLRKDGRLATTASERDLLIPPRDHGDEGYPSGTSGTVMLLQRLGASTGKAHYRKVAARIVSHLSGEVAARPADWGSLVAFLAAHPLPVALMAAAAPPASAAPAAPTFRVPDSADHVHAHARVVRSNGARAIVVTLRIDPGYHVNANPASYSYLIPTSVHFEGLTPKRILYPKPVRITPAFAKQGLNVYEGVTRIRAQFAPGALRHAQSIRGQVHIQACNDRVCLPPATLPLTVSGAGAPH